MVPSQEEHVESFGVRDRGKTWDSRTQDNNVSNDTIIPSQEDHADALGVRTRGGDRQSEEAKSNVSNDTMVPSQEDHADALGVSRPTVARWEKDRKESYPLYLATISSKRSAMLT